MSQSGYQGRCMTCGHDHGIDRALKVAASFNAEIEELRQAFSQAYFLVTGRSPAFSEDFGIQAALVDIDDACRVLRATIKDAAAPVVHRAAEQAEREPDAWIRMDHLRQAQQAPFLCRVEPSHRPGFDLVPIYLAAPLPRASDATARPDDHIAHDRKLVAQPNPRAVVSQELTTQQGDGRAALTFEQWIESIPPLTWDGWGRREAAHAAWLHATAPQSAEADERKVLCDSIFTEVTNWVDERQIPFEEQNELFKALARIFSNGNSSLGPQARVVEENTWEALFDRVALELNCLPSSFVGGNGHVFGAIQKLRATASHATKDDEREQWTSAYEKGFADGWSKGPYGSKPATRPAKADAPTGFFDVVFDGPPPPEPGRFVEVEDEAGRSFNAGEWIDRGDGLWALRIARDTPQAGRCVSDADSPFANDDERALFIQTMEEFEDCSETATDDRLLMKWACAGLLECNSYLTTEKGQEVFDAASAASRTAESEHKGEGE